MKSEQPKKNQDNSLLLKDLYDIVQEILLKGDIPAEGESYFWAIGLSEHQQLILMEFLNAKHLENLSATEVFQVALQKRASSVLLCQRSYDQNLTFGEQELIYIRQLLQVGYLIQLPLLDHLLLKEEGYYSLMQSGALGEEYSLEDKPTLTIQNAEMLAYQSVKDAQHALEASYHEDREEIALHLYHEGLSLEQIIAITGLSEETLLLLLDIGG
ncbi:MAG: JAB domain-containing protein [Aureispira sp.]